MKRRAFLNNSLALSSGLFVLPELIPGSVFRSFRPNDKVNIGLIGCGRIAREHNLPEILKYDSARVVAVSDLDSRRMADGKKFIEDSYNAKSGKPGSVNVKMYRDYRELIADKSIDAVLICTPDHWHAQPAVEAALAGKDIYIQKPFTLTISEGRILSDTVKKTNVILQVGAQCRSSEPRYRRAAELVRNGRIGRLHTVRIGMPGDPPGEVVKPQPVPANFDYNTWLGSTPEVFYHEMRVHPQNDYSRPGWLRNEQFGAGMITGWGSHFFDYSAWGMDTELTGPVSVQAVAQFPREGIWNVHGDFMMKAEYNNGITLYAGTGYPYGVKYEGDKGWIFVTHAGTPRLEAGNPAVLDSVITDNEIHLYMTTEHHGNWLDCIRTREQPISTAEMGHRACSLCLISHIAMKVPGILKWSPENEQFTNGDEANSMLRRDQRTPFGIDYLKL